MNKTTIDYLTHTWNPIVMRCTRVSPACDNCWHLRMADRLSKNPILYNNERAAYAGGKPVLKMEELSAPQLRRKPSWIGVQFMGDLFHESIPDAFIAAVFGAMAKAPQHTFLVLTKRPENATCFGPWPVNVYPGVTVENNKHYDRIEHLLQIPAAVRFVSVEPMLGPVDLRPYLQLTENNSGREHLDKHGWAFDEWSGGFIGPGTNDSCYDPQPGLHWVICGGETGFGARPMHPDWVRDLLAQCQAAGVAFHFKGWGDWGPAEDGGYWLAHDGRLHKNRHATLNAAGDEQTARGWTTVWRYGKKAAGRLLDGRTWNELPKGHP